jgi:serine-type D-Ala-D-Ala carboxypeptidase (penicillin-binding protein 5/6)
MPYQLFQGGRRRRRRRGSVALSALILGVCATIAAAIALHGARSPRTDSAQPTPTPPTPLTDTGTAPLAGGGTAPSPLAVDLADPRDVVRQRFKQEPRSGLLFDLDTGRVLWRRDPTHVLPIASLTKMMTALVVIDHVPPGAKVLVTKQALAYQGSGVGVLPKGKWIGVNTMLHGLLLPSGNDAAIALAQRAAGTVSRFVQLMNAKAKAMGLVCTRFSTPSGFLDQGNHSCASDLAAIARAVLREPRLARIVGRRQAVLPFPIKGGRLYLYNNNPLLRQDYPGTTGVKTGYTQAAGSCLVASARHGSVRLGVVLLHSPNTGQQATKLLDDGFAAEATS